MPPKKGAAAPSKKAEAKKKEKIIEDKTFGMKNKKGASAQKYIANVSKQVQQGGQKRREAEKAAEEKFKKKDDKKKQLEELNQLFRPVQDQKVGKGVDPKSVLCAFFKQGACTKGNKCKFSHDLTVERKTTKKNLYEDTRPEGEDMKDWDETQLEDVVNKKHGESNKKKPTTTIICKYFLDAVENSKYGWFWNCPNGDGCIYKHALPPGFVLKKDKKKQEEQKEVISLEELIEKERASISPDLPKLNLERFLRWKEKKRNEKRSRAEAEQSKKKNQFKQGKTSGLSGRDMFTFNPDLVAGDDDEADDGTLYRPQQQEATVQEAEDEYSGPVNDIRLDQLSQLAQEVDGTGTVSRGQERLGAPSTLPMELEGAVGCSEGAVGGVEGGVGGEGEAASDTEAAIAAALAATVDGDALPIDEDLFDAAELDEELDTLDLDS